MPFTLREELRVTELAFCYTEKFIRKMAERGIIISNEGRNNYFEKSARQMAICKVFNERNKKKKE